MVWSGQSIYAWHVNRLIAPNERTPDAQKNAWAISYSITISGGW